MLRRPAHVEPHVLHVVRGAADADGHLAALLGFAHGSITSNYHRRTHANKKKFIAKGTYRALYSVLYFLLFSQLTIYKTQRLGCAYIHAPANNTKPTSTMFPRLNRLKLFLNLHGHLIQPFHTSKPSVTRTHTLAKTASTT
jgi:hypothetical protein